MVIYVPAGSRHNNNWNDRRTQALLQSDDTPTADLPRADARQSEGSRCTI